MPVQTRSMTKMKEENYMSNTDCNKEDLRKIIDKFNIINNTPTFLLGSICLYPIFLVGFSLIFSGVYYINLIFS